METHASRRPRRRRTRPSAEARAVALAEGLRANQSLKTLLLRVNDIGADGAAALGEMLRINSSLQVLNLDFNRIGDAGAIAIGAALHTLY